MTSSCTSITKPTSQHVTDRVVDAEHLRCWTTEIEHRAHTTFGYMLPDGCCTHQLSTVVKYIW
jgi:hypothetical protein